MDFGLGETRISFYKTSGKDQTTFSALIQDKENGSHLSSDQ